MKSLLEFLGFGKEEPPGHGGGPAAGDTETVRRIVSQLEGLPAERARFVASFAFLLGRVAHADLDISDDETAEMEHQVQKVGGLPESQAVLAVEIAKAQNRLFGSTEGFQVAREFRALTSKEERTRLLHCLFAVSAADQEISSDEDQVVAQIAEELGFSHREMIEVRRHYDEHRAVVRRLDP
ncbi:MAG: TerB family tellurite resistance protein [Acidobacteriota bacterium]